MRPRLRFTLEGRELFRPPASSLRRRILSTRPCIDSFREEKISGMLPKVPDLLEWDTYWHTRWMRSILPFGKWFVAGS